MLSPARARRDNGAAASAAVPAAIKARHERVVIIVSFGAGPGSPWQARRHGPEPGARVRGDGFREGDPVARAGGP